MREPGDGKYNEYYDPGGLSHRERYERWRQEREDRKDSYKDLRADLDEQEKRSNETFSKIKKFVAYSTIVWTLAIGVGVLLEKYPQKLEFIIDKVKQFMKR